ncbi:hypothetical protein GGD38_003049 [Chitinophagaceae bacterium OAS944]|nr:hypothetical protein [Chitinophagaceae bacterium OAS944]
MPCPGTYTYAALLRTVISMLNTSTMKIKCWIGPLLAVIILFTLRQTMYELRNEQQQSVIPAAKINKLKLSPPVAATLIIRDTLPF